MLDFGLRSNVKQQEVRMRKKKGEAFITYLADWGGREREKERERERKRERERVYHSSP